ncbi:hypothetical protein MHBO_002400 [Bonamia ostreae]|uniref:Maturase K n=1 Tax=Bonamia ostreae TaxID=126728 RepID=A0ABV2AM55_9EUKA
MEIGYSSKNLTPFSAGQNLEILIKRFSVMNDPKFLSRNQNFYCQNSINLSRLYEKLASSASNFSWLNLCNFGVDKMVLAFNWQFYYNDINILESYIRLTLHLVTLYPIFLPSVLDKL